MMIENGGVQSESEHENNTAPYWLSDKTNTTIQHKYITTVVHQAT